MIPPDSGRWGGAGGVRHHQLLYSAEYLYKTVSVQICRSKDQLGSQAGVPERQMAGPNPLKGPINILELL